MKTSSEYYREAQRVEGMARGLQDDNNRRSLQATAQIWRRLGDIARKIEARPWHHGETARGNGFSDR